MEAAARRQNWRIGLSPKTARSPTTEHSLQSRFLPRPARSPWIGSFDGSVLPRLDEWCLPKDRQELFSKRSTTRSLLGLLQVNARWQCKAQMALSAAIAF